MRVRLGITFFPRGDFLIWMRAIKRFAMIYTVRTVNTFAYMSMKSLATNAQSVQRGLTQTFQNDLKRSKQVTKEKELREIQALSSFFIGDEKTHDKANHISRRPFLFLGGASRRWIFGLSVIQALFTWNNVANAHGSLGSKRAKGGVFFCVIITGAFGTKPIGHILKL